MFHQLCYDIDGSLLCANTIESHQVGMLKLSTWCKEVHDSACMRVYACVRTYVHVCKYTYMYEQNSVNDIKAAVTSPPLVKYEAKKSDSRTLPFPPHLR